MQIGGLALPINWPAAYDEALTLFIEYLGIDTFNPPATKPQPRAPTPFAVRVNTP